MPLRPAPAQPPTAPVEDDSVAGEEDPGAALDTDETGAEVPGAARPARQPPPAAAPGDGQRG